MVILVQEAWNVIEIVITFYKATDFETQKF